MHIEDLFCPIRSQINPLHRQVHDESMRWVRDHDLVPDDAASRSLERLRIPEFVARAYPEARREDLRIATDWTIWGFLADDEHDDVAQTPNRLRRRFLGHIDVLRGRCPEHPRGEHRALSDLRSRILQRSHRLGLERFTDHCARWFASMHWEATNRAAGIVPKVSSYLQARRLTVGMYTEYALFDVTHQRRTGGEIWENAAIQTLMEAAANLIGWSNDLFSYAKECELGDPHNLVFLSMSEQGLDEPEARRRVIAMHNREMQRFVDVAHSVSSEHRWQHDAGAVGEFLAMLRSWIRANVDWALSSARYGLSTSGPRPMPSSTSRLAPRECSEPPPSAIAA